MTPKCERCGASGPLTETPCRTCRGGHDLCGLCRETYEYCYFCESSSRFLTDPVQRKMEELKTIQDVKNRFHAELQQWFRKQCENPWDRYHLYYLESSPGHDGGLLICKDPPGNPEYKLASPVSIRTDLTIEQNMVHFHSVLMRLPILSIEEAAVLPGTHEIMAWGM